MSRASLRTDHFVFPAHDVARTLRFYREILGFPLSGAYSGDDWGGRPWLMMLFEVGDGRQIVLCALRGASGREGACARSGRGRNCQAVARTVPEAPTDPTPAWLSMSSARKLACSARSLRAGI